MDMSLVKYRPWYQSQSTCKLPGKYLENTWKMAILNVSEQKFNYLYFYINILNGHVPCQIKTLVSFAKYLESTCKIPGKYLQNCHFKCHLYGLELCLFMYYIYLYEMANITIAK